MFGALTAASVAVVVLAMLHVYWKSGDVFHPIIFIGPMMLFLYAWMPLKLDDSGGLEGFFQSDQLIQVQTFNLLGIICFIAGCLSVPVSQPETADTSKIVNPSSLIVGGSILGTIGFGAWVLTIVNVGGFTAAFSSSYSGGWDDNGYIRDASLLMFPAFLLVLGAACRKGFGFLNISLMLLFLLPWIVQSILTARRGPTFMIAVFMAMGWFLNRGNRPSLVATAGAGVGLGLLMLFLVSNRANIHLNSEAEMSSKVLDVVETANAGNEFIYGTGSIISANQRGSFYWGKRYLAQVVVRPIPSIIWPTKYEDFGLAELTHNAGTGEGFSDTLGWEGADGAAPGIIADLFMEFSWLALLAMAVLGNLYARAWANAKVLRGRWVPQYTIMAALSLYLTMQTMEAVIFRLLILSIPLTIVWKLAERSASTAEVSARTGGATAGFALPTPGGSCANL